MPVETREIVRLEVVLDALMSGQQSIRLGNTEVEISSKRMQTYTKGVECVQCGIRGRYWALQRSFSDKPGKQNSERFHLNLFAVNEHGHNIMMTSDHIIPKAGGGSDDLSNRQPMCEPCNNKKDDKMPDGTKASKDRCQGPPNHQQSLSMLVSHNTANMKRAALASGGLDPIGVYKIKIEVKKKVIAYLEKHFDTIGEQEKNALKNAKDFVDRGEAYILSFQRRLIDGGLRREASEIHEAHRELYLEWGVLV